MGRYLHEFLKYTNGEIVDNGWWEIKGDYVYNVCGGFHSYTPKSTDIVVECDDCKDLDWSCLLNPKSPYGWVDLQGDFYGCDFMEHSLLAELYFKSDERALENKGFVKIYRSYDGSAQYYVSRYLTEKQEITLLERNIPI